MGDRNDNRVGRAGGVGPARLLVLLSFLLGAALLCGCAGGSTSGPASGESEAPDNRRGASGATEKLGTPALGREDAPVVLTEYSDYQ